MSRLDLFPKTKGKIIRNFNTRVALGMIGVPADGSAALNDITGVATNAPDITALGMIGVPADGTAPADGMIAVCVNHTHLYV